MKFDVNAKKVIAQIPAFAIVYDMNEDSDYYVAYANTMNKDDEYTVQDWDVAIADETGRSIDNCIYDKDTGLLYIPKEKYNYNDENNIFMFLQIQLMQVLNAKEKESSLYSVSMNEDETVLELTSTKQNIFSLETVVDVENGMDEDNLNVKVNGVILSDDMYSYDSKEGELTIGLSSSAINSVEVNEGESNLSDKLLEFFTDEVQAGIGDSMESVIQVPVSSVDDIPPLGWSTVVPISIAYGVPAGQPKNPAHVYTLGQGAALETALANLALNGGVVTSVSSEQFSFYDVVVVLPTYPSGQPYASFFQAVPAGPTMACSHITSPLGVEATNAGTAISNVAMSCVDYNVVEEADGTINGYIVLALLTQQTHTQCGIGLLKLIFGNPPTTTTPPSTPPKYDPFKLYLYKMSSIPGAELNGATLGGAKFEVIRFANVEYTTVQECINNPQNAETVVWYFQTKEEDKYAGLFDGVDHTGYIDFGEESYLAPDSPNKFTGFGYPGTYWIREIKASDGFLNEGVMTDYKSGLQATDISNLGLIYNIASDNTITACNGTTSQNVQNPAITVGVVPDDAIILMEKPDVPQIQTNAYVNDTGTQYADATSDDIYCVDHVSVTNLRDQTKYTLETYLIDLTDGNRKVGESIITEIDTSEIGSSSASSTKSWEKDITIKIDAVDEGLANHTLMFVNELTDTEDGKVFEHNDTDFVEEYIYFPDSGTLATDRETGLHITYTGHNVSLIDDPINISQGTVRATVVDQIWYKNLQPGRKYEIKAWMVDVDTASAADDGNGSPIVISEDTKYFNAEAADGSVNVTFTFDVNHSIAGRKYVIFSEIYLNDELVAAHREIDDENETIWLPKVTTLLTDEQTGIDITYAKGTVKMNDAVEYTRMKPGYQYQIRGTLYNMATGEVLLDDNGNEVRVTKDVTASAENGTWEISYEFPADTLAGTIVVSYVEVYVKGADGDWHIVSEHKDFWDRNERIYMPYIDTTALDQKTNHHISYAEKTMNLYDTVHYEALRPEYTYTLVSELRDTATGQIVVDDSGKKQVLTTTFKADFDLQDNQFLTYGDVIPQNHDGSGISFSVDAEYFAGRTLVVYERLYVEGADKRLHLIADHQVLLDEKQTIHVPKVWTRALDMDTFTHTSFADGSSTIIDTFSYDNLIPGLTYELVGYIVDKNQTIKAGTPVTATGTDGKVATNRKRLTPSTSSGSERLAFEIDTSKFGTEDYNGMTFVIYEELYVVDRYDDADHLCIVARHTDIADVNQTIYVPRITTNLNDNRTGTKIMLAEKDAHLVDTVDYYRFQPNTKYTIKGRLINMETGYTLTDSKDMPVEVTKEVWTNDSGTGSWDIDYTFDATDLAGTMVVAYADVYVQNGEREDLLSHVAAHNDFWDGAQRVYIPIISTVATDQKTNSHITYAEDNVWVTDRIYYSFLKPDTEYKLISKLVDKDTGEVVIDDKGLSQVIESTFTTTPNESQEKYNQIISNPMTDSSDTGIGYSYGYVIPADGTTLPDGSKYHGVVFTFDAHTFEGRTLVIYEELQIKTTEGYKTIATHMDINDEN